MPPEVHGDRFSTLRQEMVRSQIAARGLQRASVLEAMRRVPRHEFVPAEYGDHAYEDRPLPIGEKQTISQPYIVAVMVVALDLSPTSRVLEVGTGSGYQTAILSELSGHVFSIERHKELADSAKAKLEKLGYRNISIFVGDGSRGLVDYSPYDAIVVSAATSRIPQPLLDQMGTDARMVIPVGSPEEQELALVWKENGRVRIEVLEKCRFVPLITG
jgi:protein-L-isoaspartate(D-aspartate) O-methyltransferase